MSIGSFLRLGSSQQNMAISANNSNKILRGSLAARHSSVNLRHPVKVRESF
jgi:hypothetical protein